MFTRDNTRKIKIKNTYIGGSSKVLIQTMCDIKTSNYIEVIKEIKKCELEGADLIRVSILDDEDVLAIPKILKEINIPLIGDIHFSSDLAIKAIKAGINKIRINPINTPKKQLLEIISLAKEKNVVIRIGLNEGSTTREGKHLNTLDELINCAKETIDLFEKNDFFNLVISIKSSSPLKTIKIYERLSKITDYPLHIGVTESGVEDIGIIRSCVGLVPLLLEGIGNTIRISLTKDPILEIKTAKRLLHDLNLYDNYPTLISCPTCGRCKTDNIKEISLKVLEYLENNNINLKIAVMGCIVNGIGEGKNADLGLAGQDGKFIIFKKGKIVKTVDESEAFEEFKKEISTF